MKNVYERAFDYIEAKSGSLYSEIEHSMKMAVMKGFVRGAMSVIAQVKEALKAPDEDENGADLIERLEAIVEEYTKEVDPQDSLPC